VTDNCFDFATPVRIRSTARSPPAAGPTAPRAAGPTAPPAAFVRASPGTVLGF
jgi:hypothetical protein